MIPSGNLYVVAAPSGTGKTTLVKAIVDSFPGITVSISHTTRPQRPAEKHGINYYFISETEFRNMIHHHDFLEHAHVFGNLYGTSRVWVEETLARGTDVILEIDWQGCQQIQKLFPNCTSIFILPPSLDVLKHRLQSRNQDKPNIIQERFMDVREAVSHLHEYDYIVMNDDFATAVNDLKTIIQAGRLLEKRQSQQFAAIIAAINESTES